MVDDAQPWPAEIRLKSEEKILEVDFDNGEKFSFPAEFLRVESPSAEVQGHGPGEKSIVSGRRGIGIAGLEPVGNYAVKIRFEDGHDSGIYSWETLYHLGEHQHLLWQCYLDDLKSAGLSRDE